LVSRAYMMTSEYAARGTSICNSKNTCVSVWYQKSGKEHRGRCHDTALFMACNTHIFTGWNTIFYYVWLRLIKRCNTDHCLCPTPRPVFLSRLLVSHKICISGVRST
jgi:hypothetical protein